MLRAIFAVTCVSLLAGCGVTPQLVQLTRAPYLGLACIPPCNRVGLALWLPRPARSVNATVDGHAVRLRTGPGTGAYRARFFWQGFFRDRRAQEFVAHWPHVLIIHLHVVATDGSVLVADATAPVSGGYG
jgi:hypothetical protein